MFVVLRRGEVLDCVVFVHDCGCFGVEHEELFVVVGRDEEGFVTRQYHLNFGYILIWVIYETYDNHMRYFLLSIYSKGSSITTSAFFWCFFMIERVMIGRPFLFYR